VTRYVGFDLETTGVSSFVDVPVSYSFVERVDDGSRLFSVFEGGLVNPGRPIPPGACAIHGITDEMVVDAMPLAEALEVIAKRLFEVWRDGGVIVGMNVSYDLTMVDSMCRRLGLVPLELRGHIGGVMDVLILDRHYDKWRKGSRKLVDLCGHYEVTLSNAHSAAYDAEASLVVLETMRRRFPDLDLLEGAHANVALRAWYQEWLASFSRYLEKKGESPISAGRYEWPIHVDDESLVGLGRFELPISRPPAERSRPN
jgi:DNA polymerase III subunit epsilon